MSAKGRRKDEPVPYEYLPTQEWMVERLVERLRERYGQAWLESFDELIEPCIGDGAICRGWESAVGTSKGWTGNDIRDVDGLVDAAPGRLAALYQGDGVEWMGRYSVAPDRRVLCMTNPPFSLALPMLYVAVPRFTTTIFLARTGILGGGASDGRNSWFRANRPNQLTLPDRASFDGEGSDPVTYAWFGWGMPTLEAVDFLDLTPRSVRKAAEARARQRVKALRRQLMERPPPVAQHALF